MAPAIFRYTSACRAAVVLAVAVAAALLFSSGDLSYISVLVANYFLFFSRSIIPLGAYVK
jgi:hypothetical protein